MLLGKLVLLERCSDPREAVHAREARELNINKKKVFLFAEKGQVSVEEPCY